MLKKDVVYHKYQYENNYILQYSVEYSYLFKS